MRKWCLLIVASVALLLSGHSVNAAPIFELNVTVNGTDNSARFFDNVTDMFNGLTQEEISAQLPSYTGNSQLNAVLNFRGLPMSVTAAPNSSAMRLQIPSIGVDLTFDGGSRDASQTQLEDWFKKNGGDAVNKLMKKLAETTAIDPIAGNPNSAMAQSVSNDFSRGFLNTASNLRAEAQAAASTSVGEKNANTATLAARFGYLSQGGIKSQSVSLPLGYTFRFQDPQQNISVNLPITMVDIEGSKSYSAGLGLGYSHPLTRRWIITPALGYMVTGSPDMASAGQVVSASLTSSYSLPLGRYQISMGNMAGYYRTLRLSIGDYSFDPKIQNYVVRNGLMLYLPTDFLIKETGLELFGIDTRYLGDALFIDSYEEVGLSFGRTKVKRKTVGEVIKNVLVDVRVGVSYIFAQGSHGFTANLGYSF